MQQAKSAPGRRPKPWAVRAVRGLGLGLALSVVNLAGVGVTLMGLGGLGDWTVPQFIGLFGVLEIAMGAAFVVAPNIWHLPAAEAKLSEQGKHVKFAASTVLIPHWAGGAKVVPGVGLLGWAAAQEGLAWGSLFLPLLAVMAAAAAVGASMALARLGVARPDLDVIEIVVRRPRRREVPIPAVSLGASFIQLLLSIPTLPAVRALDPGVLYQPELAPSADFMVRFGTVAAFLLALGFAAWWGRLEWQAPRPQEREAEEFVGAS